MSTYSHPVALGQSLSFPIIITSHRGLIFISEQTCTNHSSQSAHSNSITVMSSTANNANTNSVAYDDVSDLLNTVPPPPYPGNNPVPPNATSYDLTPTPHSQNRPRLPLNNRNPHLSNRELWAAQM